MTLAKTCGQTILGMPHIFTITFLMLGTFLLLIYPLEKFLLITRSNIFTWVVVLSMSWITRFNKVVNSYNVSHGLVVKYLLGSVQIFQVMFLLYSTYLLAIYPHNFMWYLMIPSEQFSLFFLRNNLLLYGMNFILIIFSAMLLLMIIIGIL